MMKITLPTTGEPAPISKILCIGRNYARHADEMESDVPSEPMVFLKPPSALIEDGEFVVIPPQSANVHHEVELVAVIRRKGKNIPVEAALDYVAGYAAGLDMTARDIQQRAKKKRHPWSVAKGFDTFAPLGPWVPAADVPDPQQLTVRLTVNGEERQRGTTEDMIFSVAELVAYCSQIFTLEPGDLIYTGTPEGVGPVNAGDRLEATITGCPPLRVDIRTAASR